MLEKHFPYSKKKVRKTGQTKTGSSLTFRINNKKDS